MGALKGELEHIHGLIKRGFYSMAFQPIVESGTARPFGFEALFRGPSGTPLASAAKLFNQDGYLDSELLQKLDKACIGSAVRAARMLCRDSRIFINIHGGTVAHLDAARFFGLLDETGIAPERVVFEISERTEQELAEDVARRIAPFRKRGVRVALDDVGIRYPWLLHMLWLEPDFVKVDRALVQGIDESPKRQSLVQGLSLLTRQMGASLIAEGVETEREYAALREMDVPLLQGYFFGRPMPAESWLCHEDASDGENTVYSLACLFEKCEE